MPAVPPRPAAPKPVTAADNGPVPAAMLPAVVRELVPAIGGKPAGMVVPYMLEPGTPPGVDISPAAVPLRVPAPPPLGLDSVDCAPVPDMDPAPEEIEAVPAVIVVPGALP